MPKHTAKERKKRAIKKVVELTGKGVPANFSRLSSESLQGIANTGKPGISRQAKLELRKRTAAGSTGPLARKKKKKKSLNDLVKKVLT